MVTMQALKEWLLNQDQQQNKNKNADSIYLLDGGVSTHLRDLTQKDFKHKELWSSSLLMTPEGRQTILQGHKDWLASGTNVLTTVTYQCHDRTNIITPDQMKQMLHDGVQLAKQAVQETDSDNNKHQFVVASMGCYGGALADGSEYTGNYPDVHSEQDLMDFHRLKTITLIQEDPDGIALETVPCVLECRAFVRLLQELQQQEQYKVKQLPACWISLACRNGQELNDGSNIEDALSAIDELDPDAQLIHAIGINCCDSDFVPSLVQRITTFLAQHNSRRAIAIYPNSGEEWNPETKTWKEGTGLRKEELQDVFADRLLEAVDMVESTWNKFHTEKKLPRPKLLLGGCCRTRPQTIAALRKQVNERLSSSKSPPRAAAKPNKTSTSTAKEQQRMLEQILARDADFDRQINAIGDDLRDLAEIQQHTGEATKHQAP